MQLNSSTLAKLGPGVKIPGYDRKALKGGIVHFGVGNFHRIHQAYYVDECLHQPGNEAWGIIGVGVLDGPASRAKAEAYKAQDSLYTITEFALDGSGQPRVVGAMIDYLHAPADPEAVLVRLAHPDTRIVTLTITEGGYNIDEITGNFILDTPDVAEDLTGRPPKTVFGFIVEGLARRRAAGLPAYTVASCDNLRGSGDTIRKAILGFAQARDAALATWIEDNVDFPNSMVDRLAPQVPEEQRIALNELSGVDDRLPVPTEAFTQWVIEDRFRHGRPPLETVGVEFRDNVAEWLAFKGRIVNGSHVLLAYPALLMGYRIVADALTDPLLVKLVETFLDRDAKPNVQGPPGLSVDAYAAKFVPRFANPAIADQLLRVAGDGAAKLPTFHGQTIRMLIDSGSDLRREAFLMACFGHYLKFAQDRALTDDRGARFDPFEPGLSEADWERVRGTDPAGVLHIKAFEALKLVEHEGFRGHFEKSASALERTSAKEALVEVLA